MIGLDRRAAGRFRTVARRCLTGRPRGPSPPVLVCRTAEAITLFTQMDQIALGLSLSRDDGPLASIAIPASLLEEIATSSSGIAEIMRGSSRDRCTWDGGASQWPAIGTLSEAPARPAERHAVDGSLLNALHECGRSASRESVRFALSRLQIQGGAGKIVGTDGRHLLIWGGWELPFEESLLVPATPVFACRDLTQERAVTIGRTENQVVVTAGPWTVWLTIDQSGRFPDVATVVPRARTSELVVADGDVEHATALLQKLPKPDDGIAAVTLEIGDTVALRARIDESGRTTECVLRNSTLSGEVATVVLSREHLLRALTLGLRRFYTPSATGPVAFFDSNRTFVTTTLHASLAIPASRSPRIAPSTVSIPTSQGAAMPVESNHRHAAEPAANDEIDFLAEAEALRDALGEVGRRAARLVNVLKNLQKQRRVLQTAWSSLKNLRLGS